jgi:hypothetical protein
MEQMPSLILWNIACQFTNIITLYEFGHVNKHISEFVRSNKEELIKTIFKRQFPEFIENLGKRVELTSAELNLVVLFDFLESLPLFNVDKKYKFAKYLKCTHDGSLYIFKNVATSEATTFIILTQLVEYVKKQCTRHCQYLAPWLIYLCLDYVALSITDRGNTSIFMEQGDIHEELKNRIKNIQFQMRRQKIHKATKDRLDKIVWYLNTKMN